jgi:hypothetical protein
VVAIPRFVMRSVSDIHRSFECLIDDADEFVEFQVDAALVANLRFAARPVHARSL